MKKFVAFGIIILSVSLVLFLIYTPKRSSSRFEVSPAENKKNSVVQSSQMKITSTAFEHNGKIPSIYTCDGENINPPLEFPDIPENAKSLVLLMDDPDVPKNLKPDGMFDHWIIYNMPPSTNEVGENHVPPGKEGLNGAGQKKYTGPCPPDREHRYFFKLYALDAMLDLPGGTDKAMVEEAMKDHIISKAELIGLYERSK